jgi:hypothetical protein
MQRLRPSSTAAHRSTGTYIKLVSGEYVRRDYFVSVRRDDSGQ